MDCRLVFYSARKTSFCERALKKSYCRGEYFSYTITLFLLLYRVDLITVEDSSKGHENFPEDIG